ncbi:hypothetical protein KJZ63_02580 [Patescibacteria group bacterium]|nr:hypothetical protein [Patescibacteria group bacterium]
MANFVHFSNVNSLFKKKNEQVWQSRNQAKLASPTLSDNSVPLSLIKPKKRFSLRVLMGIIVFVLLLVGGASAMVLSQIQQDVRQRATGCTYWNGEPAVEGASDNRGGVIQVCKNGYWSNPGTNNTADSSTNNLTNSGTTGIGAQNSSSSGGGGSACAGDEIYCGGCIAGCRKATQTCNRWIDQECAVTGCGGNGTRPGVGEKCCEGLMMCTNGRCDPTCSANIGTRQCGKYVEGSNCNNEGRWVCDVEGPSGSGHCEGGLWSNPVQEGRDEISRAIGGLDEGRIIILKLQLFTMSTVVKIRWMSTNLFVAL